MQKLQIKEEMMAVAASLALGMLAMTPGLIAGSALTESANQVPDVGTQVSTAYCAYKSGLDGDRFKECMIDFWESVSVATIISAPDLPSRIWATLRLGFQGVVRSPAFKVAVTAVA